MNAVELEHPSDALLIAFGRGQLSEEELASVDEHLANCADCREIVEKVAPDTFLMVVHSAATKPDSTEWWMAESGGAPAEPVNSGSPAPSAAAPSALTNHPRYRVGELLGIGGMGAVYKAEHLLMERPVALKVLNRKWTDKPATVERFRREVRAAARLTHPNIVAAFDAEQAGDIHFLAMEYVEGISLARRCADRGPLPVAEACEYIRQAALGLQHAHECGMVHRDIKPQNLMRTPNGQIKILDFGLSRFVVESAPVDTSLSLEPDPTALPGQELSALRLTHTGLVMGTPDYIAPEQARDSHLADIRSDIYSLGCTLYELLAGQAPFPDGNALHKVKGHLSRTPQPLDTLRRDVPSELVRIVDRMMAKDPAQRYQTPADIAKAMAPFVATKPPRRKLKVALAACAALLTIALAGVIYVQTDHGKIVIETNDESIALMIQNAGGVKIVDQTTKREYTLKLGERNLPSGDYLIDVSEPLAELDFQTKKFELKRGKEVRLTAKFVVDGDGKRVVAAVPKESAKDQGPLYLGKPANYWLNQLQDSSPKFRLEAVEALGSIARKNKELIPVLVSALKDDEWVVRDNKYVTVGGDAAQLLTFFGPDVLPILLDGVDRTSIAALKNAAEVINHFGPKSATAAPMLTQALKLGKWWDHDGTIRALVQFGPAAKPAIPAIVDLLGLVLETKSILDNLEERAAKKRPRPYDGPPSWPVKILVYLLKIDPEIKSVLPEEMYHANPSPGDRRFEDFSFDDGKSQVNPDARVALWKQTYDVLRKRYPTQQSSDPFAKQPTTDAAGEVVPKQTAKDEDFYQGKPASFWLNQLRDGDAMFRAEAVRALGTIARVNKAYIPALVNSLKDESVGFAASTALVGLGKDAVPALLEASTDPKSAVVRRNAILALGRITPPAKDAVPSIAAALRSEDNQIAVSAIFALGFMGPEAKSAMPEVVQFLGDHLKSPAYFLEAIERSVLFPGKGGGGGGAKSKKIGALDGGPPFGFGQGGAFGKPNDNPISKGLFFNSPYASIGRNLLATVSEFDPEMQPIIETITEEFKGGPFRRWEGGDGDISVADQQKYWQKIYDALKKKYPNPPTLNPLDIQTKAVTPLAPMPEQATKDDGPLYLGKPASHWLALLDDAAPEYRLDALEALGNLAEKKKDLVPVLVSVLKDNRYAMRDAKVGSFGGKGSKGSKQGQGDNNTGSFAGKGKKKGDNNVTASGAVGTVIKQRVYLGNRASAILFSLGPDVLPVLVEHVDQTSPDALRRAMSLIVSFGPKAKASAAVPMLIKVLQNKDWELLHPATEALATIGPSAKPAIPLIVDFLGATLEKKHEIDELEATLAPKIVDALLRIEPEIKAVLPAGMLNAGKVRSESGINLEAPVTLWKQTYEVLRKRYPNPQSIDSPAKQSKTGATLELAPMPQAKDEGPLFQNQPARFWLEQFQDAAPAIRLGATVALGNIAQKDKRMTAALLVALRDKDEKVRRAAVVALGRIGTEAKPALPALVEVLDVVIPLLQRKDSEKLAKTGFFNQGAKKFSDPPKYEPTFLDDYRWALTAIDRDITALLPDRSVPPKAGKGVTSAKTEAAQWRKTYEELKKMYPMQNAKNLPAEWAAGDVLFQEAAKERGKVFEGKPAAFWKNQFQDADPKLRSHAATALGGLGERDHDLIPLVSEALNEISSDVGAAARDALISLGADAAPALIKVLEDKPSSVAVRRAAYAIGAIGPSTKAAVPLLIASLKSDWSVKRQSVAALGRIGPDAKPALAAINDLLPPYFEELKRLDPERQGVAQLMSPISLPRNLIEAMVNIDSDIKAILPAELYTDGEFTYVRNPELTDLARQQEWDKLLALWQQTHDAIKKRYPNP